MAKGVINLQKESGGVTKITSTDGTGNTELVLPESGNIVSVNTAVTDNTIARYDGTTGKLQDSSVTIDDSGNLLLTSGTGALGYGTGAGGTVTQLTSKSTDVTLNKPCGVIVTHNATLTAGAMVSFTFINSLIELDDILIIKTGTAGSRYYIDVNISAAGRAGINIINRTAASYSDNLAISFAIVRGSNA